MSIAQEQALSLPEIAEAGSHGCGRRVGDGLRPRRAGAK